MKNQTPHAPPTQTPSLTDGKGIIAMKPPIISPELLKRFEQTKAITFSEKTVKEVNELLIQAELKQQNQLPDYTEVAGLKVLTQDLDKPQCPKVKLLKEGEEYKKCCCWELEYKGQKYYQYDWYGAMEESGFRKAEVLSDENWKTLEKELGADGLIEFLGLKEKEDFKGYCTDGTCDFQGDIATYWSSSVYSLTPTNSWSRYLSYPAFSVSRGEYIQSLGFSVRCRYPF